MYRAVLVAGWSVAILSGCGSTVIREDRAAFDTAFEAFQAGRWEPAVDGFTRYLRSCPTTPNRGEVYYYRGQALVRLKRFDEAKADFERTFGAQAPPPIPAFARVAIGNLHYEEGNDAKALEAYAVVLRDPCDALPMDQILLRTGVSLQRLGRWPTAQKYLSHLVMRYPESSAAVEARRRLAADGFSIQTGAYASALTAQREAARLREAGFQPRVVPAPRGAQTLQAVQVGKVSTYVEAEGLAGRVRTAGFPAMVVP